MTPRLPRKCYGRFSVAKRFDIQALSGTLTHLVVQHDNSSTGEQFIALRVAGRIMYETSVDSVKLGGNVIERADVWSTNSAVEARQLGQELLSL
jgi:hypothetical protein